MNRMNKKEMNLLLSRIEGLKSFLGDNSLEKFQQKIFRVERFLVRFGSLEELLSNLEKLEGMAYAAKDFLSVDEAAEYLQISKSSVYKMTSSRELTVYKPNGKNIYILRSDLNDWIKRNPCLSNDMLEKQAGIIAYALEGKGNEEQTETIK